jgi:hypothetical protein
VVSAAQKPSAENGSATPSPPLSIHLIEGAGWSVNAIAS